MARRLLAAALLAGAVGVVTDTGYAASTDRRAPKVALTAPTAGSTVSGTVALSATASDNRGVTQVEWYVDGTRVASDSAAPWQASWSSTAVADGQHTIVAKARDAAGNWGTSASVSVRVANATTSPGDATAPTVSVSSPLPGATVSGTVALAAVAADAVGVKQVKWYVDGAEVAWDGAAPWQASWNSATAANGQHTMFAKAADAAGNWGTSASISVTVDNTPAPPPSGSSVVAAVGDICDGTSCAAGIGTAATIAGIAPVRFFGLGDYQYQNAGSGGSTFQSGYQAKFAAQHAITIPVFGSTHDTCDGSGAWECYPVSFFNSNGAAEVRGKLFDGQWGYMVTVGNWRVIAINYNVTNTANLTAALNAAGVTPSDCLLAITHAPVIGSPSSEHPTNEASWARSTLVGYGVDLVLSGHQHFYERNADSAGFTAITNGNGGIGHYSRTSTASTARAYNASTFGVVKATLGANSWATQYVPNAGYSFADTASGDCA